MSPMTKSISPKAESIMSPAVESRDKQWAPRFFKLRAACDECHAAKVRCSGEKDGCRRCQSLEYNCVYSASRVGRNPGTRNKNKRGRGSSEQSKSPSTGCTDLHSNGPNTKSVQPMKLPPTNEDLYPDWAKFCELDNTFETSLFDGTGDAFLNDLDAGIASSQIGGLGEISPPATSLYSDFQFPILDAGFSVDYPTPSHRHENLQDATSKATHAHQRFQPAFHCESKNFAPSPSPSQCSSSLQSTGSNSCILRCTRIIEQLEEKLHESLTALDEILHINKSSLTELGQILALEQCRRSSSCQILAAVAIGHIVNLFESAILLGEDSGNGAGGDSVASPLLAFGSFEVDPEEQTALRAHILIKELRGCIHTLDTLGIMLRDPTLQAAKNAGLQRQWAADTMRRLEVLVATVDETWR